MNDFLFIFGIFVIVAYICLLFKYIFNCLNEASPADCIKHLSIKQCNKILDATVKINNLRISKRNDTTYSMKFFYLLNTEKFDFDFSDEEYDAFINYLDWFYYDRKKGKIRKIITA